MRIFPGLILIVVFLTALCRSSGTEATNAPIDAGQAIQDYKIKFDDCLAGLTTNGSSRQERGAAAFSASVSLESYERFASDSEGSRQSVLNADPDLMNKLCLLHIAYAEYQLEEAKIEANPPSVTALESAFHEYRHACVCLKALRDRNIILQNGARIEAGLARTITGLNKYADWFVKDVFMNPDGKKWAANPAAHAEKLRAEISGKIFSSDEIAACEKALAQILKNIQKAAEMKDGARALDNMILGARWLTTLLRKSPEAFINNFQRFNVIARPAMELTRQGYDQEKMKEFSRFYEPLKTHYSALSGGKK